MYVYIFTLCGAGGQLDKGARVLCNGAKRGQWRSHKTSPGQVQRVSPYSISSLWLIFTNAMCVYINNVLWRPVHVYACRRTIQVCLRERPVHVPLHVCISSTRAFVYVFMGKWAEAAESFRDVLDFQPDNMAVS